MASSPITSWQIDGETMETVIDYYLGSKNHCRWWLQPWNYNTLTSWKKSYDKLSILKSTDTTLLTKVHIVKAMVSLVVMYRYEGWTIKKTECRRTDAFELWCWRRRLRVPWTARRSNQSILKEINPEYSLEGLMLRLKLKYFGHLMRRADSVEKTLMLERLKAGEADDRGWDGWVASLTQWTRV